jgi:hypothetical protein
VLLSDAYTDPVRRTKMVRKRVRKMANVLTHLPAPALEGPADAEVTLVGWGSTWGVLTQPPLSVNLFWIRPGGKPDHDVELPKETADDPVAVCGGTEVIELRHHAGQGPVDIANGTFGVVLALLFEAALALDQFLAIEP